MPFTGHREDLPPMEGLWAGFELSALRSPDALAVTEAETGKELTFRNLSRRVKLLARYLNGRLSSCSMNKNPDGDLVIAVCAPPSIDLIVALFAILKIKGAYLPIDVDFPTTRVNYILEDCKPQLLLVKGDPSATSHLQDNFIDGVLLVSLDQLLSQIDAEEANNSTPDEPEEGNQGLGELATVLYTSGSTGTPKGVRVPHSAVLNRLQWQWKTFPYDSNEVCCFKTALTFVDSISEIFGPLLTGHQLIIIPKWMTKDPEKFVQVLEEFEVGRLVLVPSLLRTILVHMSKDRNSLSSVKLWVCSGEIFPPDLLYKFFETFKNSQTICNFYGSTEVMGDVTYVHFRNIEDLVELMSHKKVPIGKPVSNTNIYIVDSNLEQVDEGMVGELLVSGLSLAKGYVRGASPESFIQNPFCSRSGFNILYRTGDFGRQVGEVVLYEGRTDSQLKVRGHRVDLSEIETALQGIRGIAKCHVVGHKPGEIDQRIIAFYTTNEEGISREDIKRKVSSLLPIYMHPEFFKVEEIPLLVNGKVDRQCLLKTYEDEGFRSSLREPELDLTNCEEGEEEMAKVLGGVVAKILGPSAPDKISLEENFFELGGNSLNAIAVVTAFHDAGYQIDLSHFLKSENLLEVLSHSTKLPENPFEQDKIMKNESVRSSLTQKYKILPIREQDKGTIKRILVESFVQKGDLETLLKVSENEFSNIIEQFWEPFLTQGLSFVVCEEESENIIAVSGNMDYYDEPELFYPSKKLKYILEFLDECETKVRHCLPEGKGKIVHSTLMATREDISTAENVILIQVMEEQNIQVAKKKNYEAIFTTNTSKITQHVCEDVFSYKALSSYQVNKWTAEDGSKPFQHAPDNLTIVSSVCFLEE